MRRALVLWGSLLALTVGCDVAADPRTLALELTGDGSAAIGAPITLTATLRVNHPEGDADASRLAIYLPEGPTTADVLAGPAEITLEGLTGESRNQGIERGTGELEALIDFAAGTIPPGEQTLTLTARYTCARPGMAELYVDATFRSVDDTMDTVTRVEPLSVTCAGGDGGFTLDAGPSDAGATDAGASDAGATDAGATDAGATDAGPADAG